MRNHLVVALVLLSAVAARADVVLTVEAPGVQTSQISEVTTENFDGIAIGQYFGLDTTLGRLSDLPEPHGFGFTIKLADAFGGAGGAGHYFAAGLANGSSARLTFGAGGPQSYLGLWLSALNAENRIELYSAGSLVASFNASTVDAYLPSAYNGNPTNPFRFQNLSQPYAYLNFIATAGTTFDTVEFKNVPLSGLEIDNLSISSAPLFEPYPGTIIPGGVSVPAPSALAMAAPLVAIFMAMRVRRRQV
jgi:hypothetical protein